MKCVVICFDRDSVIRERAEFFGALVGNNAGSMLAWKESCRRIYPGCRFEVAVDLGAKHRFGHVALDIRRDNGGWEY
jgi:hypothetical protein